MNKESKIHICSPVMDLTTADVWRAFSATDFEVSEIYEKMYESGIAIENQRVGSLLNFAATRNIASIKTLEPDMYARINARFQNIEFMAQFGKSGYYQIGKPKDIDWNGKNHIKAGKSEEYNKKLSDLYETLLEKHGVEFTRKGNEFTFPKDDSPILVPDRPLKDLIDSGVKVSRVRSLDIEDLKEPISQGLIPKEMAIIHTTWRDYCLYMLNTTSEPLKSIWREKMVTSILSWKYATGSVWDTTIDALQVLSDMPDQLTMDLLDDVWNEEDWNTFGRLGISAKRVLSISKYPQESLEKEALTVIEHIVENEDLDLLKSSSKLYDLATLWNEQGGKSLTPLEDQQNFIGKKKVEIPKVDNPAEEGSKEFWKNVLSGARVWFRENIHSTSSWKRFSIAILKNDVTLKYLGFAQTSTERLARANAIAAFSDQKEEKEKAKKQAQRLAKQIEKERKEAGE